MRPEDWYRVFAAAFLAVVLAVIVLRIGWVLTRRAWLSIQPVEVDVKIGMSKEAAEYVMVCVMLELDRRWDGSVGDGRKRRVLAKVAETICLRPHFDGDETFAEWLREAREVIKEQEGAECPFEPNVKG